MQLSVNLPDSVSPDVAKLLLAIALLETGHLTVGESANLAGYSKATFIELASKRGVAVVNYPPEDLRGELELLP